MIATRWDRWEATLNAGWLSAERTNPLNEQVAQTTVPGHVQDLTLGLSTEVQVAPEWRVGARYDYHSGRPMSSVAVVGASTVANTSTCLIAA